MKIPVFHDDQHGTAIISGAALLNALELAGKRIGDVAGVQRRGRERHLLRRALYPAGRAAREHPDVRHQGRHLQGPHRGHESLQRRFAAETERAHLTEAMRGADVFFGLSSGNCVTPEMVLPWPTNPIVFALANPDPEIAYEAAMAARPDAIVATGRSDYPEPGE